MNILSIGNSFSQDAQRYIHQIAKSDNVNLNTFNLYIGGCSLSDHYRNMFNKKSYYTLEMNGESTGFKVSLSDALLTRDWDIITLQQVSSSSIDYATFQPYLNELTKYVRKCVPHVKIAIHQTWAYKEKSNILKELGYKSSDDMFDDIESSYTQARNSINADFFIPSGKLFKDMLHEKINNIYRDSLHASFGIGRYALGLLWYAFLTGNDINNNSFTQTDEKIPNSQIEIVKNCIYALHSIV